MPLDVGLSFIYSVVFSKAFGVELSGMVVLVSVLFGIFPDIDGIVELLQRKRLGGKEMGFHRTLTHYPILYILVVPIIFWFFGSFWTTLFFVNIISHFVHDSLSIGWGLQWLWPFSLKNFKFFGHKTDSYKITRRLVVSWEAEEFKKIMREYGDEDWFRNIYLKFHPTFIIEIMVLVLGFLFLVLGSS